jgi:hypothetical protein
VIRRKKLVINAAFLVSFLTRVVIPAEGGDISTRVSLEDTVILVNGEEASYVQYGAKDLGSYLSEITGKPVPVRNLVDGGGRAKSVIAVGEKMAGVVGVDLKAASDLGDEGFVIRSFDKSGTKMVVVAGQHPQGTNAGIATLLQKIRVDGKSAYLDGPLEMRSKPSFAVRGIHLNGWPLNYPYAFRAWKEEDWKRFVDIAWAQRVNLFYLWPFMEIIPVPLSTEDEAYLQEVRRVVDYARNQRGMEVWIMQSANRVGVSDCGTRDPRFRTYWVNNCQKDMNPADPEQLARIMKSFEALYRIVNNADAFCLIDSDPGGWPQSPLSDQVKIFQAARQLLDQHSLQGKKTKLVDWMWIGWGRHKFFSSTDAVVAAYDWTEKNPDESDVAFMDDTIRNFKSNLPEPWGLIAGMPPYLKPVQKESVLNKTVYLPYGTIESEPAFPTTNLGLEPVRKLIDKAAEFSGLRGVMGNNQLMLLQFPRTYYFFASAWDCEFRKQTQEEVLLGLAGQLYPEHEKLIAESFLALGGTDSEGVSATLMKLEKLLEEGSAGRPGAVGRFLFPDRLAVVRNLRFQLSIRAARQALLKALQGRPDVNECARLVEGYFDRLLTWNKETGWDKMIDITVWPRPIYEGGRDLTEALSRLKEVLGQGAPYASYAQIAAFFDPIAKNLVDKYDLDSVMVGCIQPLKLAVIQAQ